MLCCWKKVPEPSSEQNLNRSSAPTKSEGAGGTKASSSSSSSRWVMGNTGLKHHLDTAQKAGACQLRNLNLKEVPEELQKLSKTLRTIDLSYNRIPELPPWFVTLTSLKNLTINNSRLTCLPEEFGLLKKLEVISLSENLLTRLPDSFASLANLKTLTLSKNRLKSFPEQLLALHMLDLVDLSQNAITNFSLDMSSLQAVEVNLNQNQVSQLPDSIARCPRLKVLRLEENCLDISAFTVEIMKHSKISLFAVEGNMFDMKAFHQVDGYDEYMERFTATKKKFN